MTTKLVMEKTASQDQQQQPTELVPPVLRCPRCDSSNTKFCYYNNYSLSQPRHFCKACKRYWTRGGTLRNVPVGGGCRKNKRLKRHQSLDLPGAKDKSTTPAATTIITTCTSTTSSTVTTTAAASINKSSSSIFNQFAGLSSFAPVSAAAGRPAPAGLEGLNSSSNAAGVDLPPMLNSPWFNYPANATATSHHLDYSSQNPNPNIQELLPTDHYPFLSSPPSSLLTTTLQQQKMAMGMRETRAINDFQVFFPAVLDLHQNATINHGSSSFFKGFKMEQEGHNQVPCTANTSGLPLPSSVDHHLNSSYWNAGGVAAASYWPEVTNFGPSITPLI